MPSLASQDENLLDIFVFSRPITDKRPKVCDKRSCISFCLIYYNNIIQSVAYVMQTKIKIAGLAILELIITLCIVGILIAAAIPTFARMLEGYRLKAATELLYSDLQLVKTEAIKRNTRVRLSFQTSNAGASWCYGVKEQSTCNCNVDTGASACHLDNVLKVVRSTDFPNVHLTTAISSGSNHFTFEGIRSTTASTFGRAMFTSPMEGLETRVIVSRLARIRFCSPAGDNNVNGYPTAC
jgi:type IV fimbrial biogenesis protein FimT